MKLRSGRSAESGEASGEVHVSRRAVTHAPRNRADSVVAKPVTQVPRVSPMVALLAPRRPAVELAPGVERPTQAVLRGGEGCRIHLQNPRELHPPDLVGSVGGSHGHQADAALG
eukprot:CAMPEP_0180396150 /NCGR_PEP_ID=MMETSP0989-20121125/35285_1 /TAXON_ID=697907 /ORGANISM="non described non described, Strain CCMP2293" /LENGTH=113 /DNA_ID=CAMNT_0022398393 /DNA_START=26 /DNA_END=367 /DNA_ORIENTATION=-